MRWLAWWRGLSARRRVLTLGVAGAVVVAAGAVGLRVARPDGLPVGAPSQLRPGPVLLVPRVWGWSGVAAGAGWADQGGRREAEVLALPGDGTGDLSAQAAVLAGRVTEAVARGAPSVDVIGYSAGGVVARVWATHDETARAARRVITLGAPLQGARIAAVGGALVPGACPPACQQLTPGSALLRELGRVPLPPQLPWLSIWTEDDQTVTPPDSARLAGAVNVSLQQVCPGTRVQHGPTPRTTASEPGPLTPRCCSRSSTVTPACSPIRSPSSQLSSGWPALTIGDAVAPMKILMCPMSQPGYLYPAIAVGTAPPPSRTPGATTR